MKKITEIATSLSIVLVSATFVAAATPASITIKKEQILAELAKICEYNPEECTIDATGAGNGGGNEPPYIPRKPKQPKTPNKDK